MDDAPSFGRYSEIPEDRMTPEQRAAYRHLVDGPRGGLTSDLRLLDERGVAAAVLGMALYTGALDGRAIAEEFRG